MSDYVTIVIRMPKEAAERSKAKAGLKMLEPYQTGMSMEDEMTILELIEAHPEFQDHIAEEARAETSRLHADAEASA